MHPLASRLPTTLLSPTAPIAPIASAGDGRLLCRPALSFARASVPSALSAATAAPAAAATAPRALQLPASSSAAASSLASAAAAAFPPSTASLSTTGTTTAAALASLPPAAARPPIRAANAPPLRLVAHNNTAATGAPPPAGFSLLTPGPAPCPTCAAPFVPGAEFVEHFRLRPACKDSVTGASFERLTRPRLLRCDHCSGEFRQPGTHPQHCRGRPAPCRPAAAAATRSVFPLPLVPSIGELPPASSWAFVETQLADPATGLLALVQPDDLPIQRGIRGRRLQQRWEACMSLLTTALRDAIRRNDERRKECVGWLLLAAPRMLQRRGRRGGARGRRGSNGGATSAADFDHFLAGRWDVLWAKVQHATALAVAAAKRRRGQQQQQAASSTAAAAAAAVVDPVAAAASFDGDAPDSAVAASAAAADARKSAQQKQWRAAARSALKLLADGDYRPAMQRVANNSGLAPGPAAEVAAKLQALHPQQEPLFTEADRADIRAFTAAIRASWQSQVTGGSSAAAGPSASSSAAATAAAPSSSSGGSAFAPLPDLLHLDPRALRAALASIPRKSAGGGSGWLSETVRDLAFSGADNTAFSLVHMVLQEIVRGSLPQSVADALGACILIGLDKGGGGVRPIAMSDCLRRSALRALCLQYAPAFQTHFSPLQYGVATPGGCEQIVLTSRALLEAHPDWCILRLDCRNAFNACGRRNILFQLKRHFPELLPVVCQFYLGNGRLFYRSPDGQQHTVLSVTGVQQGDPLAPALFALGIHPALQDLAARFPGVHVMAYLDDIHLIGPPAMVWPAFCYLRTALRALGLLMSPGKCHVWSPTADLSAFGTDDPAVRYQPDGFAVLGVPFGPEEGLSKRVLDVCMQEVAAGRPTFAAKAAALRCMAREGGPDGPKAALLLFRMCALPSCGYLFRCLPPAVTAAAAAAVDGAVREFVAAIGELPPIPSSSIAADVLQLPIGEGWGGCGLYSASVVAPLAHAASFLQNAPAILERLQPSAPSATAIARELQSIFTAIYAAAAPPPAAAATTLPVAAAAASSSGAVPPPPVPSTDLQRTYASLSTTISQLNIAREHPFAQALEDGPQPGLQRVFTQASHARLRADLDQKLASAAPEVRRRIDSSRGYAAGAWLRQLPRRWPANFQSRGKRYSFNENLNGVHFCNTLRLHLHLPFPQLLGGRIRCCVPLSRDPGSALCGALLDEFGHHSERCPGLLGSLSIPHNLVRNATFVTASEAGLRPVLEPPQRLADPRGAGPDTWQRPADVLLPASAPHGLQRDGSVPRDICIDATCRYVLRATCLHQPVDATLRAAHARKQHRPVAPNQAVFPLAFASAGGAFLPEGLRVMLTAWASRMDAPADDGDGSGASEERRTALDHRLHLSWLPRFSAVAHLGFSMLLMKVLDALDASTAGWDDDDDDDGAGCGDALRPRQPQYSDYVCSRAHFTTALGTSSSSGAG